MEVEQKPRKRKTVWEKKEKEGYRSHTDKNRQDILLSFFPQAQMDWTIDTGAKTGGRESKNPPSGNQRFQQWNESEQGGKADQPFPYDFPDPKNLIY